jgi:hypothetical protein
VKVKTLEQSVKQHNVNALHDAFIAAGLVPVRAESSATESRFVFDDSVANSAIQQVIDAYTFAVPQPLADLRQLAQNFRTAVQNATTVLQLKSALNQELMLLLRELAISRVKDL